MALLIACTAGTSVEAGPNLGPSPGPPPPLSYDGSQLGTAWVGGENPDLIGTQVTTIEFDMELPHGLPDVNDIFYLVANAFDNNGKWDQVGFAAYGGGYHPIWASMPNCGHGGQLHIDYDIDANVFLEKGTDYHFRMLVLGNAIVYEVFQSGNQVWQYSLVSNALFFKTAGRVICGFDVTPSTWGYTVFEEVIALERQPVPDWNFKFRNIQAGGIVTPTWGQIRQAPASFKVPNDPMPFIDNPVAGEVDVYNEWFDMALDLTSLTIPSGTTSAGTWGRVDLNSAQIWGGNCGGTGCSVQMSATGPVGWGFSFNPLYVGMGWVFSFTLSLPANAGVGSFDVVVRATDQPGAFQSFDLRVTISQGGGGGGGGGCVAEGTLILTPGGLARVERLGPGDRIVGYDVFNHTFVNETVISNARSRSSDLISINGGRLVATATNQPLWVSNGTAVIWLRDPRDLAVGDFLFEPENGTWLRVDSLSSISSRTRVYDLIANGPNTFVANGILADQKTT